MFSGTAAYTSNILTGINWAISHRSTYNIVAINMSLGDGSQNTAPCSSGNPYVTATANAQNAGITVVAAAGNEAYSNALSAPACTPGVISVGAVYAANFGGLAWGNNLCTDYTSTADQITCFSDSASFLTLLAPGALVTAAGITEGGTSQAAPHVAGAVAVLRAAFPSETLSSTLNRLTSSGVPITDSRNGLTKPRLDLAAAAHPANDNFSARVTLSGNSGTASGTTLLGTEEVGEPNPVANSSQHTSWWKWVAPASGQVSLDTHGSGFDTLLSVYTGSAVNALQPVAWNDNDGSAGLTSGVLFEAKAGTEYEIAVDGISGAQGQVTLNWALNASAQANLSITSMVGPVQPSLGSTDTYAFTVNNSGPQVATHVVATVALPAGVSFVSSASNCSALNGSVSCALGNLASGTSASVNISLMWGATTAQTLAVSVTSDLPDPVATDNSASLLVATVNTDNVADAPTLPQWAAIMMAGLLLVTMAGGRSNRRDR